MDFEDWYEGLTALMVVLLLLACFIAVGDLP